MPSSLETKQRFKGAVEPRMPVLLCHSGCVKSAKHEKICEVVLMNRSAQHESRSPA
jgi:hypothetical protein